MPEQGEGARSTGRAREGERQEMRSIHVSRAALAVALVIAGATVASAKAADAVEAAGADDAIVVTGKSIEETLPQELSRYGSDLAIVTEARVKDSGAVDVATALRSVPGIYIQPASGPFSYVDVSIQGSRTQDVLWTVDGVRINNRLYGSTSPNDTLPASMIERIEVLKGGESLFYGTQAAAGVINVVTRSFADDFGGHIDANADTYGGTNVGGYVRDGFGRHRFVAWGSYNRTKGFAPFSAFQPSATDRKRGYDLWSVGGKYQYDFTSDLLLNLQYQHTQAKLDNLSPTLIRESRNDRNEEIASARLDYTGNDVVKLYLKGYYHDWSTAYVQIRNNVTTGAPVVIYPAGTFWGYKDYGGSALVKLRPHRGLEYLLGYDFQKFSGRDDVLLIGKTLERVHAGVLQVRTTDDLSSRARLAAGLRYNDGSGAKKTVWNVSGRFDLTPEIYAEANGGTSFLLPSASQLYQIDPCCEKGNPNLKPEESLNGNFSLGGNLLNGALTLQATYFARRIDNLITIDFANAAFPDGIYSNSVGRVNVRGGEGRIGYAFAEGWRIDASYTHTQARNRGSDLQINRIPKDLATGTLAYSSPDNPLGANVSVNWVGAAFATATGIGRRNYGNYAVVDAGVHVFVDRARRHRLGLNVENLFDKNYATRGYQTALRDSGGTRFEYFTRGVPLTVRGSYGVTF
jgi:vitamin B12 transporter